MNFFRYKLPFKKAFTTSGESYSHREGFIIQCDYLAFSCFGDVAPLPGFSNETIEQVNEQILRYKNTIDRYFMQDKGYGDWKSFADTLDLYPSLRFGLDTFLFDRLSKKRGISMNKYFSAESCDTIPVNATIGIDCLEETIQYCKAAWSNGFRNFKIKMNEDLELAYATAKYVRETFPKSNIRIDPNQSWNVDQAISFLNKLSPLNIEFCEQPVEGFEGLSAVHEASKIPIAADESARDQISIKQLIEHNAVDILILKPMMIGSFDEIFSIAKDAKAHDIETVFTTSLESGVGRLATAHLASLLGSKKYAHGLATGQFLQEDILSDEECLVQGNYKIPDRRGIGLNPELESSCLLKPGVS